LVLGVVPDPEKKLHLGFGLVPEPEKNIMSKLPHFLIENSCYFLTSTTYNRKPIFHNDHYAKILCNIIYNLRKREKMSLLGFVIMPEHFHLLIIPAKGIEIPWIMQEIKKGSARLMNPLPGLKPGVSGLLHVWHDLRPCQTCRKRPPLRSERMPFIPRLKAWGFLA